MKKSEEVLISVLAGCDALWEPHRSWDAGPVIDERRRLYRSAGLPWAVAKVIGGVPDTEDRKAVREAVDRLELRDLIDVGNPSGLRTTTTKLTEAGDDRARALVGLCHFADSWELLQLLYTLREDPRGVDFDGQAWASEVMLTDVEWGGEDTAAFADVQCAMLPALCRGYVESTTSIKRHCWYALTGAGVSIAKRGTIPDPGKLPNARPDCLALYLDRLQQARRELRAAQPATIGSIGLLPFPVCPPRRGSRAEAQR
jgi:hypothetical protein